MQAYTVVLRRPDYLLEYDSELDPYYTAMIDSADGKADALLQAQIEAFGHDAREDLVPEDVQHRSILYSLVVMFHGIQAPALYAWQTPTLEHQF